MKSASNLYLQYDLNNQINDWLRNKALSYFISSIRGFNFMNNRILSIRSNLCDIFEKKISVKSDIYFYDKVYKMKVKVFGYFLNNT